MKCPNCRRDDNLWEIRADKVRHIPCDYTLKAEEMLDIVRSSYVKE